MNVSRKDFLKVTITGGLGVLFGGAGLIPPFFRDKGARLVAVRRQSLVMGSVATFEAVADSKRAGYEAIRQAVDSFRSLDRTFSMYREDSEMVKLSRQSGSGAITLSPEARKVLNFAKQMYLKSGGLFDVTIEPAMRRWGFRSSPQTEVTMPTHKELMELEKKVGSRQLQLEGSQARLVHKGMAVDTGGIVGGFALDAATDRMKAADIAAAFINFSGDIKCFGRPVSGRDWEIHILDPYTQEPFRKAVSLHDEALSTSGAYQNRRHSDVSHSWGHLLNPSTAKPVEPVGSVTAIHSSAMMADAWSTAAYVGAEVPKEVRTLIY